MARMTPEYLAFDGEEAMTISVERARMIRGPLPDVTNFGQPRDLFPLWPSNARGRSMQSGFDRCIRAAIQATRRPTRPPPIRARPPAGLDI